MARRSDGLRDFGTLERLERHFDAIDEVLITDSDFAQEKAVDLVDRCHGSGIRVRVAPSTMEILMDRVEFVPGQSLPLFELKPPLLDGVDFVVKRAFDVVGSLLLLTLLSPVMAMMAAAIKLDSRGPIMFRSKRPGIGGAPFACLSSARCTRAPRRCRTSLRSTTRWAARSSRSAATRASHALARSCGSGRWTSCPQLFNVLRGDMSLVGPRPLPERDYERLEEWHRKRYLVLPGMTGLWQVSGRAELDFDELVRLDFLYLERWSVFLDLTILLKTLPAVFRSRGAW